MSRIRHKSYGSVLIKASSQLKSAAHLLGSAALQRATTIDEKRAVTSLMEQWNQTASEIDTLFLKEPTGREKESPVEELTPLDKAMANYHPPQKVDRS